MSSSEPSKWTTALGASADVNVIPATTPAGTGLASMASIFPAITQVPIDSGGIAPERADFNALFKMLGDQSYFLQQGGVYSYSASYAYRAGDLVMYNGNLYLCIQAHAAGAAAPSNTSYWRKLATLQDIPPAATVNNGQLTINVNGSAVATFTANQAGDSTANITVPAAPTVNNGELKINVNGSTVATFTANQAGNTTADITISEIDSQSVSGTNGWVRFKSGIQIVFGSGSADIAVNYPVAFIAPPTIQMTTPIRDGHMGVPGWYAVQEGTTYFVGAVWSPVDNAWISGGNFSYIAIGFWKYGS